MITVKTNKPTTHTHTYMGNMHTDGKRRWYPLTPEFRSSHVFTCCVPEVWLILKKNSVKLAGVCKGKKKRKIWEWNKKVERD